MLISAEFWEFDNESESDRRQSTQTWRVTRWYWLNFRLGKTKMERKLIVTNCSPCEGNTINPITTD